jgi:transcriptional regulator with XRE-family HTH domain
MINNIRKVRESLGMSIEEVASKTKELDKFNTGMRARDIEKYENAEFVQVHTLTILARAMNVERTELVDWEDDED